MKEGAIVELIKCLKPEQIKSGLIFGIISNLDPISVTIGDIELEQDNLKINSSLTLLEGDKVALMASNDKRFYVILCKVVDA